MTNGNDVTHNTKHTILFNKIKFTPYSVPPAHAPVSVTALGTTFFVDLHNSGLAREECFKSLVNGRISKNQRHRLKIEASNYLSLVYYVPRAFP